MNITTQGCDITAKVRRPPYAASAAATRGPIAKLRLRNRKGAFFAAASLPASKRAAHSRARALESARLASLECALHLGEKLVHQSGVLGVEVLTCLPLGVYELAAQLAYEHLEITSDVRIFGTHDLKSATEAFGELACDKAKVLVVATPRRDRRGA